MSGHSAKVMELRRPVQRAVQASGAQSAEIGVRDLRDGSTGRVVRRCGQRLSAGPQPVPARQGDVGGEARTLAGAAAPRLVLVPARSLQLERVWAVAAEAEPAPPARQPEPEMAFYRRYTEALLRRYLQMSVTSGRVPSLMGREMFQGNVTHCRTHTMEDVVIFCMDVEKTLHRLQPMEQRLIARIALQHYSQGEAAAMLGLSLRHAIRRYNAALDRLTAMLLEARMLEPLKSCQ